MDAVLPAAETVLEAACRTTDNSVLRCRYCRFCQHGGSDSPSWPARSTAAGEADAAINGRFLVLAYGCGPSPNFLTPQNLMGVAEKIKQTAFAITRAGQLMSREASRRLRREGIVDLSLRQPQQLAIPSPCRF